MQCSKGTSKFPPPRWKFLVGVRKLGLWFLSAQFATRVLQHDHGTACALLNPCTRFRDQSLRARLEEKLRLGAQMVARIEEAVLDASGITDAHKGLLLAISSSVFIGEGGQHHSCLAQSPQILAPLLASWFAEKPPFCLHLAT